MNSPIDLEAPPLEAYEVPMARPEWQHLIRKQKNGIPHSNLDNAICCIENDPELAGKIWRDEFLDSIITTWQGPERKWIDADTLLLQLYLQRHIGLTRVGSQTVFDAVLAAASRNLKNECRTWVQNCQWDATPRLEYMLADAFGAPQNPYTAAVGRCWITSIVARVMNPGCQVDTVPVLEGYHEGEGKSSALRVLGGKWFTECHESVMTKDFFGVLDGNMLVEISEMHSFNRSEVERVKGIISNRVDRYRRAYGRTTEDHPRKTVLVCTTNHTDWHKDSSGGRRFWPITCGQIDLDYLRTNREQLFGEALIYYEAGKSWWDVPQELQREEINKRRESDPWEEIIYKHLLNKTEITIPEIMIGCLNIEPSRLEQAAMKRIARLLRVTGWEDKNVTILGRTVKKWFRVKGYYT